jgi:hypothetical protein
MWHGPGGGRQGASGGPDRRSTLQKNLLIHDNPILSKIT